MLGYSRASSRVAVKRHGAHGKTVLAEIVERGFEAVIEIAAGGDQMKWIGMKADLMAEIAYFAKRVPHPLRAVPGVIEQVAMHDEEDRHVLEVARANDQL